MPLPACRLGLLALAAASCCAADPAPLIANGGFEAGSGDKPAHWNLPQGVVWGRDEERFLRLTASAGHAASATRQVALGDARALRLSLRVRHAGLRAGDGARCLLAFRDRDGRSLGPALPEPCWGGSSEGWIRQTLRFPVPAGAAVLAIAPTVAADGGGTLDLDDIVLTAIDPGDLPPMQTDVAGNPLAPADGGGAPLAALRCDGARLVDAAGAAVELRGVALDAPALVPAAWAAQVWKATAVAIALDGARWDDEAYRRLAGEAVLAATSRGARALVSLTGGGEPARWGAVAATFAGNPGMLADLGAGEALPARLAAVRAAGLRQPVLAEGELADPAGGGVVRVLRLRCGDPDWPDLAALAARQPLLVVLAPAGAGGAAPYSAVPEALARVQAAGCAWIAAGFEPGGLVAERTAFTPTAPWGAFVRAALKGTRYAGKMP